MNVLILGSGGREHAMAWKVKQSPLCDQLFVAPGNPGTDSIAVNIPIRVNDFESIGKACIENAIDLIIVGPEDPLVNGIVDFFEKESTLKHIKVFGPHAAGAQLEGSKDFAKEFMFENNIPTAGYRTFDASNFEEGLEYISKIEGTVVLKADGLAAGKGVIITDDTEEAQSMFTEMIQHKKFGDSSTRVVIEEFLDGVELSVFVVTDGESYVTLPEAKDYKRIGEGNTGLNTGGMGALSPVPFANEEFLKKIDEEVVQRTISGLKKQGLKYRGFIFFGLINVEGQPKVIEYNVRMGDPETEAVLLRCDGDLLEVIASSFDGSLQDKEMPISKESASTVMLVSGGYPEAYEKGKQIHGLEGLEGVIPFHAGTSLNDGHLVTNGGRVIAMSALGDSLSEALAKSNKAAKIVDWEGRYYRTDIGFDIL